MTRTRRLLLALLLFSIGVRVAWAAWPRTPLTTYVSNTTPVIHASDLNSFQSAINGIILGTYSEQGITVDGTGGATVTSPAGSLVVSRLVAATTTTPTPSVAPGELPRGLVPMAWASLVSSGGLTRGVNISGITHTANTGVYSIALNPTPNNYNGSCIATPTTAKAFTTCSVANAGGLTATVTTYNTAGTATDTAFNVVVFGE